MHIKNLNKFFLIMVTMGMFSVPLVAVEYTVQGMTLNLSEQWVCEQKKDKTLSCVFDLGQFKKKNMLTITIDQAKYKDHAVEFKKYFGVSIKRDGVAGAYNSKVYFSKFIKKNGVVWVDSLHYGSELKNYFTRYLISRINNKVVLYNFTVHKSVYTPFAPIIEQAYHQIGSAQSSNSGGGFSILSGISLNKILMSLFILFIFVIGFIWYRRK